MHAIPLHAFVVLVDGQTIFLIEGCTLRKAEAEVAAQEMATAAAGLCDAAQKGESGEAGIGVLGRPHHQATPVRCRCWPPVLRLCSSRRITRARLYQEHPLKVRWGERGRYALFSETSHRAYAQDISTTYAPIIL